jgi:hypothetical protein
MRSQYFVLRLCKNLMMSKLTVDYWLQLDEYSNRVANCLLAAGFKHGQSIALFMENRLVSVLRIRIRRIHMI